MNYEFAAPFIDKAKELGRARGQEVSVAVVDAGGHIAAVAKGKEEAWHGPYMSIGKARLSAAFRKPSAELVEQWTDRPLYAESLIAAIPGGVVINPGGFPLFQDGVCVGAIGIGGGSPAFDHEIAEATVRALDAFGTRK